MPRKGGVPENLIPPKMGERRNPNGRPKLPDLKDAMAKVLAEEKDGMNALEAILKALRAKASKGDVRAAQELLDRGFGKSKQQIEHTGDAFENVTIEIIRK
jgi:alkylation response protein AidB-like acyl-CoA dehydrogenase